MVYFAGEREKRHLASHPFFLSFQKKKTQLTPQGLAQVAEFDTRDGVYDVAWSEAADGVVATAGGDGSVKLWAVNARRKANPAASFQEHAREVSSLSWNVSTRRELLLSASWDDSVRLWDAAGARPRPLAAFLGAHQGCCYGVSWNPRHSDVFATCGGDGLLKIWDARRPPDAPPTLSVPVVSDPGMGIWGDEWQRQRRVPAEALCLDWCKYNDALLAVGSVDRCVRLIDVRRGGGSSPSPSPPLPVSVSGSRGPPRARVRRPPRRLLAAPGGGARVGLLRHDGPPLGRGRARGTPGKIWDHHSEFAVGLDFSTLVRGRMASCGWDDAAFVWSVDGADPRAPSLF